MCDSMLFLAVGQIFGETREERKERILSSLSLCLIIRAHREIGVVAVVAEDAGRVLRWANEDPMTGTDPIATCSRPEAAGETVALQIPNAGADAAAGAATRAARGRRCRRHAQAMFPTRRAPGRI